MPEYRKMPEATGRDIMADVDKFWEWFRDNERFYPDLLKVFQRIKKPFGPSNPEEAISQIRRYRTLVSGESAGGFLAAYSWLSQPDLRFTAIYLQYPMLKAYTREPGQKYRDKEFDPKVVKEAIKKCQTEIENLKQSGKFIPRVNSDPPEGMDMAFASSTSKTKVNGVTMSVWTSWFK